MTVGVDRFHVAHHYHDGVDRLRKQELKRLQQELPGTEYEPLTGLLGVIRQAWTGLSEADQNRVLPLFHPSPAFPPAYCLRQVLTGSFNRVLTKDRAPEAIQKGCDPGRAGGVRCFDPVFTTVENWREELHTYFLHRQNSGFVEGLNNQLKVVKRRGYGLNSVQTLFQCLWLDLKGYGVFGLG